MKKALARSFSDLGIGTLRTIRIVTISILLVIVAINIGFGGFYTVSESESAVVTRFGRLVTVAQGGSGLKFKIPFIDKVQKVDMKTRGHEFGYYTADNGEYVPTEDSVVITRDNNFVNIDFYAEWRVSDPYKFLYASNDPITIMNDVMRSVTREVAYRYTVDEALTTAKGEIQGAVKEGVIAGLESYDIGIQLKNMSIQDTEPPTQEIGVAFKAVENARQGRDTKINEANQYASELLPQARVDADKIIQQAEAKKQSRIDEAMGQVERFNALYAEYAKNPEIVKTRIYMEYMEEILPNVKVYIGADGSDVLKFLPLEGDSQDEQ